MKIGFDKNNRVFLKKVPFFHRTFLRKTPSQPANSTWWVHKNAEAIVVLPYWLVGEYDKTHS